MGVIPRPGKSSARAVSIGGGAGGLRVLEQTRSDTVAWYRNHGGLKQHQPEPDDHL